MSHYSTTCFTGKPSLSHSALDYLAKAANKGISTISSSYLWRLESCPLGVGLMQTDITQTLKQSSAGSCRYKLVFAWGYTYVNWY